MGIFMLFPWVIIHIRAGVILYQIAIGAECFGASVQLHYSAPQSRVVFHSADRSVMYRIHAK